MDGQLGGTGFRDVNQDTVPVPGSRLQCPQCQQTFSRSEHLIRHSRSHMKERSLKCKICQKGFYRLDALRRHESVHQEPRRSALKKGARACTPCAAARRRCTGGLPCEGCEKRSLVCEFPLSGSSKDIALDQQSRVYGQRGGLTHSDTEQTATDTPMSWSNDSFSPETNPSQDRLRSLPPRDNGNQTDNSQASQTFRDNRFPNYGLQQEYQNHARSSFSNPEDGLDNSALADDGQNSVTSTHTSGMHALLQASNHIQSLDSHLGTSNENQSSESTSTPWYPNDHFSSSINWLPEGWTPNDLAPGFPPDNLQGTFNAQQSQFFGPNLQTSPNYERLPDSGRSTHRTQASRDLPNLPPQSLVSQDTTSPSAQSTRSGHFYVDGDGARLPRVRRAPYSYPDIAHGHPNEVRSPSNSFMFPACEDLNSPITNDEQLPASVYEEILQVFNLTCVSSNHYTNFEMGSFPSVQKLSRFIRSYQRNFGPTFPFLHLVTFDVARTHWLLLLAMSAIGSHYCGIEAPESLVVALHEFLRRAIQTEDERKTLDTLTLTQVKLLSCVGMMYCGDQRLRPSAGNFIHDLVSFCKEDWVRLSTFKGVGDGSETGYDWDAWIKAESCRRTGYCIWLLDCMWVFHFQFSSLLSLEDAKVPVPCQEVLWEAEITSDWQQLYSCAAESPSLHSAIQLAYIEKRVQSSMGEFSRILCIHALFRRTWEVETYFQQPLTLWTPTAEKQKVNIERPIWLPGIPTYAKWRNSACDCLDILHWHANSVIGAASGMEHPTVLHLHLARVILLTPYRKIVQLVRGMIDGEDVESLRKEVRRWAREDSYKSRLSMIHAGVLFWHVRRYSTDAFYEASSVFLATLALWAYGTFAPHEEPSADELFPTSIQLDRPADDELVQLFVKRGATMKANIMGVGNLCEGAVKVLMEGRKLLLGMKWGEALRGVVVLDKLIEMESR